MLTTLSTAVPLLLYWYGANKRSLPWRTDPTPYHVWISEIMLQQTRVEAVKPYYARFLEACPSPAELAEIDDDRLMKLWEGLGYYSRARNLKKAARILVEEHGGSLPFGYDALRALPGIGDYTAGAIASIAQGLPTPAVDGNVLRVVSRLLAIEDDIAKPGTKKTVTSLLARVYPTDPEGASSLSQALMELGALVCIPNGKPLCDTCPLKGLCRAHEQNLTDRIPHKAPKKPRTVEKMTVLVLRCGDAFALRKRPASGLLAGMWELPHLPGHLNPTDPALDGLSDLRPLGAARHIFTHREWDMIGYSGRLPEPCGDYVYKTAQEIRNDCAIPSAFSAYLPFIKGDGEMI